MKRLSALRHALMLLALALLTPALWAWQPAANPWTDLPESAFARKDMVRRVVPDAYRTLALDFEAMKAALAQAPDRSAPEAAQSPVVIMLPMPDGTFERFRVVEASVMHPELQARYPGIRSYAAQGLSDPTAYARLGYSHKGFHAMVLSARHSTVFIDPYAEGDVEHYISYYKKDFHRADAFDFECKVDGPATDSFQPDDAPLVQGLVQGDCSLRKYRLALACTGEYAQYHGGTKPDVLAEFNVAMTRVNGIYERELAVTMELVPNTDTLIFLFASTDPYTNNSGGAMLSQNQTTCDNRIGPANYDIGHVFSTGGGGVAGLAVVCASGAKARGVTGLANPVGDPFYVDYVAHEMGHQFGGNHTFNNSCGGNRNNSTAVEPGSGSTIMAYAGICSPNVQNASDDYFHAISIEEITTNIEAGTGSTCPMVLPSNNNAPSVDVPATEYTLPVGTPFMLTATATDPDAGDMLTYCWEQMDNEIVTQPPLPTNTGGPAFRTLDPVPEPTRYFPNLDAIVNNQTPTWEVLPSVSRDMDFRVTVRDNHLGAGCTDAEDVHLTFTDQAGPFLVTEPNTAQTWLVGEPRTITWDVANTDQAPVGCAEVDILLSLDGGYTWPVTLAQNVPNTGSYLITVPDQVTNSARIMVRCATSIFFDISNENFTIELPPEPTFFATMLPSAVEACPDDTLSFEIVLNAVSGFAEAVTLSMSGLPPNAMVSFSQNGVVPPATITATLTGLTADDAGQWTITLNAQSSSVMRTINATLTLYEGMPASAPLLATPADGLAEQPTAPTLSWNAVAGATSYRVLVDRSPAFDTGVPGQWTTDATTLALDGLDEQTVYYWRVQALNACGEGPWSATFAFQTGQSECLVYSADDLPVPIPSTQTGTYTSTIEVPDDFVLTDVNVPELQITHTWVGDLGATLTAPDGTTIVLFDQPGVPDNNFGCSGDNMDVSFDDDAPNGPDILENMCNENDPVAIVGDFQPIDPLATFNGMNAPGTWTLAISDNFNEDGGSLDAWALELCRSVTPPATPEIAVQPLIVAAGSSAPLTPMQLMPALDTPFTYTLLALPANGTLDIGGTQAGTGATFTQAALEAGIVTYAHDGGTAMTDTLLLDALSADGGWLHGLIVPVVILQNTLALAADVQDASCQGAADGRIAAVVSGGYAPFSYSLDGGPAQSDSIFQNLPAGTYQLVVTDVYGFADTANVVVAEPDPLTVNAQTQGDSIVCAPAGGTPPYQYSLDGQTFQNAPVFGDLPDGVYTVTVMDAHGCTAQEQVILATQALVAAATLENDITCNNDNDATISVMAAGGIPPYTYSLDGQNFQSAPLFTNLPEGSYTVIVQDDAGFQVQTNTVVVTNPPPLQASATVTGYQLMGSASGGTPPYTYSLDGQNFQSNPSFTPGNGTWTLTVMDSHGCTATAQATLDVAPLTASAAVHSNVLCFGGSQGSIIATASGGVPPYEYSLNGIDWQTEPLFDGLPAGTYVVQVRDAGGVMTTSNLVTLSEPPALTVTAVAANYQIEVTASGGTPPYTYSLDGGPAQTDNVFTGIDASGDYLITVVDSNGCTVSIVLAVSVVESADVVFNEPACAGDPVQMVVTDVTGGTPPYEYSLDGQHWQLDPVLEDVIAGTFYVWVRDANGFVWQSPPYVVDLTPLVVEAAVSGNDVTLSATGGVPPYTWSIDGTTFFDAATFEDLPNGNYTGYVADANGCVQQVNFTIDVVQGAALDLTDPSCAGSADGEIEVTAVDGGSGPYSYSLDGQTFQDEPLFTDLPAGNYTLYIQDASGFVFAMDVTLTDPAPLTLETTLTDDTIVAHASGGTPPYQYSIDGGVTFQTDSTFSDLPPGDYTVLVRDLNGCLAFVEVSVMPNAATEAGALSFALWPNPTDGRLYLRLPDAGRATIELFDLTGRTVMQQRWLSPNAGAVHTLDLHHLPAGSYTIRIVLNDRTGIRPLIVVQ